jgi:hypothetical protein
MTGKTHVSWELGLAAFWRVLIVYWFPMEPRSTVMDAIGSL